MNLLLAQAERLGVQVSWQPQPATGPEAAYQAPPGQPGLLMIRAGVAAAGRLAAATPALCMLLSHEMVHVLQHWRGNLQAITPLGWPTDAAPAERQLSIHEAEAYSNQNNPQRILEALQQLQRPQNRAERSGDGSSADHHDRAW